MLDKFISDEDLSERFNHICSEIGCRQEYILRLWSNPAWHDEIDIIATANLLSSLKINSDYLSNVFEENKKLLNHIIENYDYYNYFMYYEPKVAGDFLLLFYDKEYHSFLSKKSKKILTRNLKKRHFLLRSYPLVSKFGAGKEKFYGLSLAYVNNKISDLMYLYALKEILQ